MNKKVQLTVSEENKGKRLDRFLSENLTDLSRTRIQSLIKDGFVSINDNPCSDPAFKIKTSQCISITIPEPAKYELAPVNLNIKKLYEDDHIIIIDKPSNLSVHPGAKKDEITLVHGLLYHIKDLSGIGGILRPGIVHRLDKDTTGALIIAKSDKAHIMLSNLFKERKIKKTYICLVMGRIKEKEGTIKKAIKRDELHRKRMRVTDTDGREAITKYRVIEELKGLTLLEVKILTGRTHQIRVHLSSIGHPLAGDPLYGGAKRIKINDETINFPRYLLHAHKLEFMHPILHKEIIAISPIPDDMQGIIEKLRSYR